MWLRYDMSKSMEEILHQLIDGKHSIIYSVSTILLVMQDFATIHSMSMDMDID